MDTLEKTRRIFDRIRKRKGNNEPTSRCSFTALDCPVSLHEVCLIRRQAWKYDQAEEALIKSNRPLAELDPEIEDTSISEERCALENLVGLDSVDVIEGVIGAEKNTE